MSEQHRSRIMERLRTGVPPTAPVESDFSVISEKQWPLSERLLRLRQRLESVNGRVHECGRDAWVAELQKLLAGRKLKALMYAPGTEVGDELDESWDRSDSALPALLPALEPDTDIRERVFQAEAAVTGTLGGIADTGSLMLWPTAKEPRLMSLAPPLHIALLDADRIYNTFWEAINQQRWAEDMPTNALLISGPSKTADIEQQLSYGVHGPRELIVLIRS
ncbi:MAG: lactate utilization protein [Gammaproteobacteria bacterium]|nr:lactate utilization protein [Gammaproteobacteria bacterium]